MGVINLLSTGGVSLARTEEIVDDLGEALGPYPRTFLINQDLAFCTSNNPMVDIEEGESYTAVITPNIGQTLAEGYIKVTMGGRNITDIVYSYNTLDSKGNIYIPNVTGSIEIIISAVEDTSNASWIVFESKTSVSIVSHGQKTWDGTIEYSSDKITWQEWDGIQQISSNYKLYLRGSGNTIITGNSQNAMWSISSDSSVVTCTGDISRLLDYANVSQETIGMGPYCFKNLFAGNSSILCTCPRLNLTTLSYGCYSFMFYRSGVEITPILPATTLQEACYSHMFRQAAIRKISEISATALARNCYNSMFAECTQLETLPVNLFPITTLERYCYSEMFLNCTGLKVLPALPATSLSQYCYYNMFNGCSSIKLSSEQVGEYQTAYRIPYQGLGTTAGNTSLSGMFLNTGGSFANTPVINVTYYTSNTVINPS